MKNVILGDWLEGGLAKVDLTRLLVTRMLLQAGSGFGKSYALRRILEQSAGSVQQFVIDPDGEFATLREKYDYVIAAVNHGDALAHPRTAGLLLRRLMETGVSAILDISELKKPERRHFVRLFVEGLMELPRAMWSPLLVVIDEAHEFAPEKDEAESLAAIVDLATRGRKRGFALLAATQRIGKFSKDAAAELHNKLIGFTSLDIDVKRAAFELGMSPKDANDALRELKAGDFYAFGPAIARQVRALHIGEVATTHPEPGTRKFRAPPKPTAAIMAVLPKLADLPKEAEAEARSIDDLRRELTTVKRELAQAKRHQPAPQVTKTGPDPATERRHAGAIARLKAIIEELMKFIVSIEAKDFAAKAGETVDPKALQTAIEAAVERSRKLMEGSMETRNRELQGIQREAGRLVARARKLLEQQDVTIDLKVQHNEPFSVTPAPKRPATVRASIGDAAGMPKGEASILAACIQFPDGLRREQLTVLTGYKRSTRDAYIQRLGEKGFVAVGSDGRITATAEGVAALPNAEPLPTGVALQEYWIGESGRAGKLPKGEADILRVLVAAHPAAVQRDDISEQTGFKRSTRDAYLQRLDAKELIKESGRGAVIASETLF